MEIELRKAWMLTILYSLVALALSQDCGPPPIIEHSGNNATLDDTFPEGTEIRYFCDSFTDAHGWAWYTCENGRWTNGDWIAFVCVWKSCDQPKIEHGTYKAVSLTVGNFATFTCDEGYKRVGPHRALCRINKEWRGVPKCERVRCERPREKSYMRRWQNTRGREENIYGNLIENTCGEGYKLIGPAIQKCESDGQWTRPDPYCEVVDCGIPDIGDGEIEYDGTDADSIGYLTCSGDATLEGDQFLYCFEDGWTYSYCHAACDVPYIQNGQTTQNRLLHGQVLDWHCDKGFMKTAREDISCHSGNLTSEPACREPEFNLDDSCPAPSQYGPYVIRYQNSCYTFMDLYIDFELAKRVCRSNGGTPVIIDNRQEMDFISMVLEKRWKERTWLGIEYSDTYDDWLNVKGSRLSYTNWQSGEGGKFLWISKYQKCAVMERKGHSKWPWDDVYCDESARVICEVDPYY